MRKVTIRALQNAPSVLLTLNRVFYVLKPQQAAENLLTGPGQTIGYKIASMTEREATQHFEVFEEQDWLVLTDESQKFVNFYRLSEVVA